MENNKTNDKREAAIEPEPKNKYRLNFDFSAEAVQRLDEIKNKSGATTRAEVIRNALRYYEWFLEATRDNNRQLKLVEGDKETLIKFI